MSIIAIRPLSVHGVALCHKKVEELWFTWTNRVYNQFAFTFV